MACEIVFLRDWYLTSPDEYTAILGRFKAHARHLERKSVLFGHFVVVGRVLPAKGRDIARKTVPIPMNFTKFWVYGFRFPVNVRALQTTPKRASLAGQTRQAMTRRFPYTLDPPLERQALLDCIPGYTHISRQQQQDQPRQISRVRAQGT